MPECNPANMIKLVNALESGEYKQAQQRLRNGDRYCCLGVATDLAIKENAVNGYWEASDSGSWFYRDPDYEYETLDDEGEDSRGTNSSYLPPRVAEWLGISGSDIYVGETSASILNDGGDSFREIAQAIRAYYLSPGSWSR